MVPSRSDDPASLLDGTINSRYVANGVISGHVVAPLPFSRRGPHSGAEGWVKHPNRRSRGPWCGAPSPLTCRGWCLTQPGAQRQSAGRRWKNPAQGTKQCTTVGAFPARQCKTAGTGPAGQGRESGDGPARQWGRLQHDSARRRGRVQQVRGEKAGTVQHDGADGSSTTVQDGGDGSECLGARTVKAGSCCLADPGRSTRVRRAVARAAGFGVLGAVCETVGDCEETTRGQHRAGRGTSGGAACSQVGPAEEACARPPRGPRWPAWVGGG